MTRKINSEPIDQEEFMKRLRSGDDDGLDDFEKEAFEGFSSLDNAPLAEKLNSELNKKIEEKYLAAQSGRPKWIYYSMAAGLALIIGLSVIFFNNITGKEPALAMKTDDVKSLNEQLQNEVAQQSEAAPPSTEVKEAETVHQNKQQPVAAPQPDQSKLQSPALGLANGTQKNSAGGAGNGPVTSTRLIEKEETPKASPEETRARETDDLEQAADKNSDGAVIDRDEKYKAKDSRNETANRKNEAKADKKTDDAKKKTAREEKEDEPAMQTYAPAISSNATAPGSKGGKKNNSAPEPSKAVAADVTTSDRFETETKAPAGEVSGKTHTEDEASLPLRRSSYFKTAKFDNHADYFKAGIEKNETLKNNLKAYGKSFRIDLTVSENGKVLTAKADLPEDACAGCKTAIEKIIKEMPLWEPAQNSSGKAVMQSFYFNYRY